MGSGSQGVQAKHAGASSGADSGYSLQQAKEPFESPPIQVSARCRKGVQGLNGSEAPRIISYL